MLDWSGGHDTGNEDAHSAVVVNATTRPGFLSDIEARLSTGKGFTVATLNLDHVVKLRHDLAFRDCYRQHTHVTADGNPIVWLSRLAGQDLDLVPGSELIEPLAEIAARHDVAVAFVGSTEHSLDMAANALINSYPGLRVVAKIAPAMGFNPTGREADACIAQLKEAKAQLCFLALGAPKQEIFAIHAHTQMPECGFLSIGAGLDFISELQTRAPAWIRRLALEWLWRLVGNPRRLAGRYAACIAILPGFVLTALRNRITNRTRL